MGDENATKARESDAIIPDAVPMPSETQAQPAMCDACTSDRPMPATQAPTGEITKLGGVDAYISKPSDYPHAPSRLLLLLTGGTGLQSANNQLQADLFASEGYVVVMPDLFDGNPAPNSSSVANELEWEQQQRRQQQPQDDGSGRGGNSSTFIDVLKMKAAETAKSFLIDMWLARHTAEKVMPILKKVMSAMREEFADAVGDGVYAVGYCFGGRYVLLLAAEPVHANSNEGEPAGRKKSLLGGIHLPWLKSSAPAAEDEEAALAEANKSTSVGPLIKAGALAHATLVSPDDFKGLRAPVSVVCVENDPLFPDEVRMAGEDYMSKKMVEHEVQVYPGVPHGFAIVGEYEDVTIKSAQATAHGQMLKWLKEH